MPASIECMYNVYIDKLPNPTWPQIEMEWEPT